MLELTLFEYFREIKNILISVFMAGLCLLIAILYSFLDYENGKLKPFKSLSDKNGYVTYDMSERNNELENYLYKRDIADYKGIEKEYISYKTQLTIGEKYSETFIYESFIWDNWHGRIKEGRWFKKQDINSEYVPIILGGDTEGYKVGDTYVIDPVTGVKGQVIGLLQDKTEIFDIETYSYYDFNYSAFYKAPNYREGSVFVIAQAEAFESKNLSKSANTHGAIYIFEDSLTKEELNILSYSLYLSDRGCGKTLATFIKESEDIARQKIYTYVPTIIVSFLIMFVAIYCISYIKIQNSGKIYSIYYLNGANRTKIYGIATGYAVLTILFSAVFYVIGGIWFDAFSRKRNIMYSFWGSSIKLPLLLYLIFGVTMSLCLIIEIRNKTVVELLRQKAL